MRVGYEKQLKRGVLKMVVLSIVCQETSYGYKMIKTLNENTDGFFNVKEGTLYPILYRLEDEGLICSKWGDTAEHRGTKPKKMYSAKAKGYVALLEMQTIWQGFENATNMILSGKDKEVL